MALGAVRNHRGFFSDYWLGTLLGSRRSPAPRLTADQLRRRTYRLSRLVEVAGTPEGLDLTRFRERFARPLLGDVFDFTLQEGEPGARLHSMVGDAEADGARAVACLRLCPKPEELDARPARRELEEALLAAGLDHGFLLSPDCLRLIRTPGSGSRGAAFDLVLPSAALPGDDSLAVAYRILSAGSFEPGPAGRRPIDVLEAESREHSAQVCTELKGAVFEAAERIVGAFVADTRERTEELGPVPLGDLRDAGFLALYRLLFILYAEARDERLAGHRLYQASYALEPLIGELLKSPRDSLPAKSPPPLGPSAGAVPGVR